MDTKKMDTTTTTIEPRSGARAARDGAPGERDWRGWLETGLIVVGLAALLLFLGHHLYSDAEVRYEALSTLLLHGTLDPSKFSLIGLLFSTPIWIIGGWLHLPHRGLGLYNWCVFTLGVSAPSIGCSKTVLTGRYCAHSSCCSSLARCFPST